MFVKLINMPFYDEKIKSFLSFFIHCQQKLTNHDVFG